MHQCHQRPAPPAPLPGMQRALRRLSWLDGGDGLGSGFASGFRWYAPLVPGAGLPWPHNQGTHFTAWRKEHPHASRCLGHPVLHHAPPDRAQSELLTEVHRVTRRQATRPGSGRRHWRQVGGTHRGDAPCVDSPTGTNTLLLASGYLAGGTRVVLRGNRDSGVASRRDHAPRARRSAGPLRHPTCTRQSATRRVCQLGRMAPPPNGRGQPPTAPLARSDITTPARRAGVTQLAECLLPKRSVDPPSPSPSLFRRTSPCPRRDPYWQLWQPIPDRGPVAAPSRSRPERASRHGEHELRCLNGRGAREAPSHPR